MKAFIVCAFVCAILSLAVSVKIPTRRLHYPRGKIPIIGLGTWNALGEEVKVAVDAALEAGYRLIDTAALYGNEKEIGEVINRWIDAGKLKREDIQIMTKIPPTGMSPQYLEKFLNESLANLNVDYIDILLDHVPTGFQYVEGNYFPTDNDGNTLLDDSTDINAVWKEMEKAVKAGRVKHIGLSNYNQSQIQRIIKKAEIKPSVVEVELFLYFQQKEMVKFCERKNIQIVGYSPLGAPNVNDFLKLLGVKADFPVMLDDPVVKSIAEKYHKTPAQILLRHAVQKNIVVIPKSVHPERVRENIDIFDFKLSRRDMRKLNSLDQGEEGRRLDFTFFKGVTKHPEFPFTSRINHTIAFQKL